jgi:hypothetical protein
MTTIQIELPDATAKASLETGFLTPAMMEAAGVEPMSLEGINAEVKAVRAERRLASGR